MGDGGFCGRGWPAEAEQDQDGALFRLAGLDFSPMTDDLEPTDKEFAALMRRMYGRPRKRPVNFWVQALRDGTIVFAAAQRRPYHKKGRPKPFVDEDGCFSWSLFDEPVLAKLTDTQRIITVLSITQKLNTKKMLREQVEARLERIEKQLEVVVAKLELLAPAQGHQRSPSG